MLLFALAEGAATLADAGAETHSGVFEDGNGAKKYASEDRNQEGEEQETPINADFTVARKSSGSEGRKKAKLGISMAKTDGVARQSEIANCRQRLGDI